MALLHAVSVQVTADLNIKPLLTIKANAFVRNSWVNCLHWAGTAVFVRHISQKVNIDSILYRTKPQQPSRHKQVGLLRIDNYETSQR